MNCLKTYFKMFYNVTGSHFINFIMLNPLLWSNALLVLNSTSESILQFCGEKKLSARGGSNVQGDDMWMGTIWEWGRYGDGMRMGTIWRWRQYEDGAFPPPLSQVPHPDGLQIVPLGSDMQGCEPPPVAQVQMDPSPHQGLYQRRRAGEGDRQCQRTLWRHHRH